MVSFTDFPPNPKKNVPTNHYGRFRILLNILIVYSTKHDNGILIHIMDCWYELCIWFTYIFHGEFLRFVWIKIYKYLKTSLEASSLSNLCHWGSLEPSLIFFFWVIWNNQIFDNGGDHHILCYEFSPFCLRRYWGTS